MDPPFLSPDRKALLRFVAACLLSTSLPGLLGALLARLAPSSSALDALGLWLMMFGIYGSPTLLIGAPVAWRMLRRGADGFFNFALAGLIVGGIGAMLTLLAIVILSSGGLSGSDLRQIIGFALMLGMPGGLGFALLFRAISGHWRAANAP